VVCWQRTWRWDDGGRWHRGVGLLGGVLVVYLEVGWWWRWCRGIGVGGGLGGSRWGADGVHDGGRWHRGVGARGGLGGKLAAYMAVG